VASGIAGNGGFSNITITHSDGNSLSLTFALSDGGNGPLELASAEPNNLSNQTVSYKYDGVSSIQGVT
jgi:hypothetical protein